MGQMGLPHVTPQILAENKRFVHELAYTAKHGDILKDKEKFIADGWVEKFPPQLTKNSVAQFEAALDSASLIFGHSIVDSVALDYLRVCAIVAPKDFLPFVGKKQITLAETEGRKFEEFLSGALEKFFEGMEKESLMKKVDTLFALCKPPAGYAPLEEYAYDRGRLEQLDKLRHDYVHLKDEAQFKLPNGADDIRFLQKTTWFFLPLVHDRYGTLIDPRVFQEVWAGAKGK
jgi:hypothetical protein